MNSNDDERTADKVNRAAKYTNEFRCETAGYIISTGRAVTECCRELGLNPKTVNKWIARRRRKASGEPDPKAGESELHKVQRRTRELEMECAFLKKPHTSSTKSREQPRATVSCRRRRANSRFP